MYHHIRGDLVDLSPTAVVVEAAGVGFHLRIPLSTYEALKGRKEALVFTHLHVREDELRLFGFGTKGELELFRLLLAVSGVGPSIALAALCALTPAEVVLSIVEGDLKTLQRTRGVGKKLAERLVLELKDRVGALASAVGIDVSKAKAFRSMDGGGAGRRSPEASDAILALVTLGFDRREAESRVDAALLALEGPEREAPPRVETLIKACLRSR